MAPLWTSGCGSMVGYDTLATDVRLCNALAEHESCMCITIGIMLVKYLQQTIVINPEHNKTSSSHKMAQKTTAPHGLWPSPLTAEFLSTASISLQEVLTDVGSRDLRTRHKLIRTRRLGAMYTG